jgi:hypothetical protein
MPEKGIHIFCDSSILSREQILQRYPTLRRLAGRKSAPCAFVLISGQELLYLHSRSDRYGFSLIKLKDPESPPIPMEDPLPIALIPEDGLVILAC